MATLKTEILRKIWNVALIGMNVFFIGVAIYLSMKEGVSPTKVYMISLLTMSHL